MIGLRHAAAFAAATLLVAPVIAHADDYPLKPGDYVEVTSVTVDDGHSLDYAKFLAGFWKDQEEFAKSQGWITGYEILANVNKRPGEADLYLVRRYRSIPDGAELDKRADQFRKHMAQTDAQMSAASGERAKFRHVIGSQLLQVINFK
jgi:hypothetical protein